jgi:hypothetical protein
MAALAHVDNPVLWQEYTHQERTGPRWMRWGRNLGVLVTIIAFAYVLSTLQWLDQPTRETALFVIWITHILVATRCIVAGANAISREHVAQTWDALVLTGVSGRLILLGKYRAALARVRGWALALGIVRLAMLPIFVMAFLNRVAYWRFGRYSYGYDYYEYEVDWLPWAVILSVVMTVALTLLDVLCCTALGLASSAVFRRGSIAAMAAILIRFAPVTLFAALTRYEIGIAPTWRVMRFTPFALADGGTAPLYQLVLPVMDWTRGRHEEALPGLLLATGLIVLLLIVALVTAFVAIRSTGALPHPTQSNSLTESSSYPEDLGSLTGSASPSLRGEA